MLSSTQLVKYWHVIIKNNFVRLNLLNEAIEVHKLI